MRKLMMILLVIMLPFTMTACSGGTGETTTPVNQAQSTAIVSTQAPTDKPIIATVTSVNPENSDIQDDPNDYLWESSSMIPIVLNGNTITASGNGVTVDGGKATITSAGTYSLSGSLSDGQIVVDTKDKQVVRLILNGVDIHNTTSAAINILNAERTVIVLADQTENSISDGEIYTFEGPETNEPNAAIFSKSDLTLFGSGSLTVNGNFNDGIASKDGLIIASGTIMVNAVDDGIRGKDYLAIKDGNITVNAGGDGLKSDNEEDAAKGYISITAGVFNITSNGDAIQGQTDVMITDGEFMLISGGGSKTRTDENTSAKGIDAVVSVVIDGGAFTIDSADDAIHSNTNLVINNGMYVLATGDDGIHADSTLEVNGGDIHITQSYEGMESAVITINAGNIHIISSDDAINVAGGNDGSGMNQGMRPQRPGGGAAQDASTYTGKYFLYINGGYIVVADAGGDGIDVNGAIEMTDGVVIVNGPTEQMNGALDYDAYFKMTGGFIIAAGSSGMAQMSGASSSQASVLIYLTSAQPANTLVHIQNDAGEDILTFSPSKPYQSIAFSSPKLVNGATYKVYTGGSSTGTANDGLYQSGVYTTGTQFASFTISDIVTTIGTGGGRARP